MPIDTSTVYKILDKAISAEPTPGMEEFSWRQTSGSMFSGEKLVSPQFTIGGYVKEDLEEALNNVHPKGLFTLQPNKKPTSGPQTFSIIINKKSLAKLDVAAQKALLAIACAYELDDALGFATHKDLPPAKSELIKYAKDDLGIPEENLPASTRRPTAPKRPPVKPVKTLSDTRVEQIFNASFDSCFTRDDDDNFNSKSFMMDDPQLGALRAALNATDSFALNEDSSPVLTLQIKETREALSLSEKKVLLGLAFAFGLEKVATSEIGVTPLTKEQKIQLAEYAINHLSIDVSKTKMADLRAGRSPSPAPSSGSRRPTPAVDDSDWEIDLDDDPPPRRRAGTPPPAPKQSKSLDEQQKTSAIMFLSVTANKFEAMGDDKDYFGIVINKAGGNADKIKGHLETLGIEFHEDKESGRIYIKDKEALKNQVPAFTKLPKGETRDALEKPNNTVFPPVEKLDLDDPDLWKTKENKGKTYLLMDKETAERIGKDKIKRYFESSGLKEETDFGFTKKAGELAIINPDKAVEKKVLTEKTVTAVKKTTPVKDTLGGDLEIDFDNPELWQPSRFKVGGKALIYMDQETLRDLGGENDVKEALKKKGVGFTTKEIAGRTIILVSGEEAVTKGIMTRKNMEEITGRVGTGGPSSGRTGGKSP